MSDKINLGSADPRVMFRVFEAQRERSMAMRATGVYIMFAIVAIASWSGCYTTRAASGDGKSALLRLEVTPPEAHIYIDEQYQGRIDRWRDQTIPVRPGPRRVELQAEGYITQRFDVEIGAPDGSISS